MDREFKAKWVAALRSGEYGQSVGGLKQIISQNPDGSYKIGYCCLGVACDISGLGEWVQGPNGTWTYSYSTGSSSWDSSEVVLPDTVAVELGLDIVGEFEYGFTVRNWDGDDYVKHEMWLTSLNDAGFTFGQIADIIDYFL